MTISVRSKPVPQQPATQREPGRDTVSERLASVFRNGRDTTIRIAERTAREVRRAACSVASAPHAPLVGVQLYRGIGDQGDLVRGLQEALSPHGLTALTLNCAGKPEAIANAKRFARADVRAVIYMGSGEPPADVYGELLRRPFLRLGGLPALGHHVVTEDVAEAGRAAAAHLLEQGCTNIALLTHDQFRERPEARLFYEGYCAAACPPGVRPRVYVQSAEAYRGTAWSWTAGARRIAPDIIMDAALDGLVCYDSHMAYAVAQAASGMVPHRLAIIGCNDWDIARIAEPPLSTVAVTAFELGRAAGGELVRLLAGESVGTVLVPPQVTARQSSARRS